MLARGFVFFFFGLLSVRASAGAYLSSGFGSGGTELKTITGGQDYETRAGDSMWLSGGFILPVSPTVPHAFELQCGAGLMYGSGGGGDREKVIDWVRIPLEAIYFYRNTRENFRIGAGPIYHFANRLKGKGVNESVGRTFDNALGWTFVVDKVISGFETGDGSGLAIGARYNVIKYSTPSVSGPAEANVFYLTFSVLWL